MIYITNTLRICAEDRMEIDLNWCQLLLQTDPRCLIFSYILFYLEKGNSNSELLNKRRFDCDWCELCYSGGETLLINPGNDSAENSQQDFSPKAFQFQLFITRK